MFNKPVYLGINVVTFFVLMIFVACWLPVFCPVQTHCMIYSHLYLNLLLLKHGLLLLKKNYSHFGFQTSGMNLATFPINSIRVPLCMLESYWLCVL